MANKDFLPRTDAGLRVFTKNFGTLLAENFARYGISEEAATAYNELQQTFAERLEASLEPLTSGKRTVFLKNESRDELAAITRSIARQIDNLERTTDDQRQALGLTIRDTTKTPVPPPSTAPLLGTKPTQGRSVLLTLRGSEERRAKPFGALNATVVTYSGPTPPMSPHDWTFAAIATRSTVELPFGSSDVSDTVWITAFWTSRRGQSGPAATPLKVNLPAGVAQPTVVKGSDEPTLKIAA